MIRVSQMCNMTHVEGNLRWPEELLQKDIHAPRHLRHQEVFAEPVESAVLVTRPLDGLAGTETLRRRTHWCRITALADGLGCGVVHSCQEGRSARA